MTTLIDWLDDIAANTALIPEARRKERGNSHRDQVKLYWHVAGERPGETACGKPILSLQIPRQKPRLISDAGCGPCSRAYEGSWDKLVEDGRSWLAQNGAERNRNA